MRSVSRHFISAAILAGIVVGTGACANPEPKADSYDDSVRKDFMATCTENVKVDADGGTLETTELASTSYCECAYEAISDSKQIPIDDLNEFESKMAEQGADDSVALDGSVGAKLEAIFKDCADSTRG